MLKAALMVVLVAAAAAPATAAWTTLGTGVTYQSGGTPCRVALFFGGYGYLQTDSQLWVTEVAKAANFATAYGISDFIAIKGPADSMYNGKEIGNSHIVSYLKGLSANACAATGATPLTLLVVDHSSGGFVAAEFMGQMLSSLPDVLSRTIQFDLDGGSPPAAAAKHLRFFFPTSTIKSDGTLQAMNYNSLHPLCSSLGLASTNCRFVLVRGADNSGCITASPKQKGVGSWCLHMFMINQKPHSQSLAGGVYLQDMRDVSAAHPIQTDWIVQTTAELSALFTAPAAAAAASAVAPGAAAPSSLLQRGAALRATLRAPRAGALQPDA